MNPHPRTELLLFFLLTIGPVWCPGAQSPSKDIPPPAPPFVADPPGFSAWTIQSKSTRGSSAATTSAIHTEGLERFETGGREIWYANKVSLTAADNDPSKIVLMAPPGAGPMPDGTLGPLLTGPGFPGFWWLDLRHYKGVVNFQGRSCYHFRMVPPPAPASTPQIPSAPETKIIGGREFVSGESPSASRVKPLEAEAWIDVETKLPVAILHGGQLHTYTFLAPPAAKLSLPESMKQAIARAKSRADRLRKLEKKFSRQSQP